MWHATIIFKSNLKRTNQNSLGPTQSKCKIISINATKWFLANRSFAQVECNQNPNENIDSIQNRVFPGKSRSTGFFWVKWTYWNQTQSTILNHMNIIDSKTRQTEWKTNQLLILSWAWKNRITKSYLHLILTKWIYCTGSTTKSSKL